MVTVWDEFPSSVIQNCWLKCGIVKGNRCREVLRTATAHVEEEIGVLKDVMNQLVGESRRISIEELLNEDHNEATEDI